MRRYQPTTEEVDALFIVNPSLNEAIDINNDHFYDEDTTNEQRELINKSIKNIYKYCLKISISNTLLPFG